MTQKKIKNLLYFLSAVCVVDISQSALKNPEANSLNTKNTKFVPLNTQMRIDYSKRKVDAPDITSLVSKIKNTAVESKFISNSNDSCEEVSVDFGNFTNLLSDFYGPAKLVSSFRQNVYRADDTVRFPNGLTPFEQHYFSVLHNNIPKTINKDSPFATMANFFATKLYSSGINEFKPLLSSYISNFPNEVRKIFCVDKSNPVNAEQFMKNYIDTVKDFVQEKKSKNTTQSKINYAVSKAAFRKALGLIYEMGKVSNDDRSIAYDILIVKDVAVFKMMIAILVGFECFTSYDQALQLIPNLTKNKFVSHKEALDILNLNHKDFKEFIEELRGKIKDPRPYGFWSFMGFIMNDRSDADIMHYLNGISQKNHLFNFNLNSLNLDFIYSVPSGTLNKSSFVVDFNTSDLLKAQKMFERMEGKRIGFLELNLSNLSVLTDNEENAELIKSSMDTFKEWMATNGRAISAESESHIVKLFGDDIVSAIKDAISKGQSMTKSFENAIIEQMRDKISISKIANMQEYVGILGTNVFLDLTASNKDNNFMRDLVARIYSIDKVLKTQKENYIPLASNSRSVFFVVSDEQYESFNVDSILSKIDPNSKSFFSSSSLIRAKFARMTDKVLRQKIEEYTKAKERTWDVDKVLSSLKKHQLNKEYNNIPKDYLEIFLNEFPYVENTRILTFKNEKLQYFDGVDLIPMKLFMGLPVAMISHSSLEILKRNLFNIDAQIKKNFSIPNWNDSMNLDTIGMFAVDKAMKLKDKFEALISSKGYNVNKKKDSYSDNEDPVIEVIEIRFTHPNEVK